MYRINIAINLTSLLILFLEISFKASKTLLVGHASELYLDVRAANGASSKV